MNNNEEQDLIQFACENAGKKVLLLNGMSRYVVGYNIFTNYKGSRICQLILSDDLSNPVFKNRVPSNWPYFDGCYYWTTCKASHGRFYKLSEIYRILDDA